MLGIGEVLGAEAAADIGRDEAHVRRLDAERAGAWSRLMWMFWLETCSV